MSDQFKVAFIRGVITGAVLAGGQFCALAPIVGVGPAAYGAGVIFFGTVAARGLGEGAIDTAAAKKAS